MNMALWDAMKGAYHHINGKIEGREAARSPFVRTFLARLESYERSLTKRESSRAAMLKSQIDPEEERMEIAAVLRSNLHVDIARYALRDFYRAFPELAPEQQL